MLGCACYAVNVNGSAFVIPTYTTHQTDVLYIVLCGTRHSYRTARSRVVGFFDGRVGSSLNQHSDGIGGELPYQYQSILQFVYCYHGTASDQVIDCYVNCIHVLRAVRLFAKLDDMSKTIYSDCA